MTEAEKTAQPPLSTRECAEFLGVSRTFILEAIRSGELRAEAIRRTGKAKALYRVHEDDFVAWLKKIGWSRLPKTGTDA